MIQLTRATIKFLSLSALLILGFRCAMAAPLSGFYADIALGTAHMNAPSSFDNIYMTDNPSEIVAANIGTRYAPAGHIGLGYNFALKPPKSNRR